MTEYIIPINEAIVVSGTNCLKGSFLTPSEWDRLCDQYMDVYPEDYQRSGQLYTGGFVNPNLELSKITHYITTLYVDPDDNTINLDISFLTSKGYRESGVVSTEGDMVANLYDQDYPFEPVFVLDVGNEGHIRRIDIRLKQ